MDRKLVGLVAVFLLFFGAFLSFLFFDTGSFRQPLRASVCDPDPRNSHLFAFPLEMTAGGTGHSSISVFVRNPADEPCSGKTVSVSTSLGQIEPGLSTTDENGKAVFNFTCGRPGLSQLRAIVNGSLTIEQSVTVECT